MAQLVRQVINGTGNQTFDSSSWKYVRILGGVSWVSDSKGSYSGGFMSLPWNDSVCKVSGGTNWQIEYFNYIPPTDPSALRMFNNDGLCIANDEEVVRIGQSVDLTTVDVSGIRLNCDELSKLFMKALGTRTATDAARYLKLKAAVLALYGPK